MTIISMAELRAAAEDHYRDVREYDPEGYERMLLDDEGESDEGSEELEGVGSESEVSDAE